VTLAGAMFGGTLINEAFRPLHLSFGNEFAPNNPSAGAVLDVHSYSMRFGILPTAFLLKVTVKSITVV
jgi:hypothetical protein